MSPRFSTSADVSNSDSALEAVFQWFREADPDGSRFARVFRQTFDQLYDGQRTGRYRWDQLFKTEKTHYGTLIEINLQREFKFEDGDVMDYKIAGHEIDCKYSASGQWMLPPESLDHLILASVANDQLSSWSIGIVRATPENRNAGQNRDHKGSLSAVGKSRIRWLFKDAPMQPNILLQLPVHHVTQIFSPNSGQGRVNELFRLATDMRISRNIVATVAQQSDFMKRVRASGGARTILRPEGYLILGGDYAGQKAVAKALGTAVPEAGEVVSVRVGPIDHKIENSVELDGITWHRVGPDEASEIPAPLVPGQ
ncbi:NaeI family type II restriction endonuclease [Pseudarthrobacter sp. J1763]|uniref:NaeI family type II restriction endonuclease n=1 Tax=Pseudarthrobacter sp. J1763 TaxID=3420445 RepID=UPI003D2A0372